MKNTEDSQLLSISRVNHRSAKLKSKPTDLERHSLLCCKKSICGILDTETNIEMRISSGLGGDRGVVLSVMRINYGKYFLCLNHHLRLLFQSQSQIGIK